MLGFFPIRVRVAGLPVGSLRTAVACCALLLSAACGGGAAGTGPSNPGGAGAGEAEKQASGPTDDGRQPAVTNVTVAAGGDDAAGDDGGAAGEGAAGAAPDQAPTASGESAEAQATASSTSIDVKVKGDRRKMSEFLVEPAKKAIEDRNYPQAVALYQALVVARGAGSPEARELARAWLLAAQPERAMAVVDGIIRATDDPKLRDWAREERQRLIALGNPFASKFAVGRASAQAGKAFQAGRKEFKAGNYGDALVYYEMGYALDPDLPGFLREMGATYDKLGAADKKAEFYMAYLRRRPIGKNADEIRKELKGKKGLLGTLTVQSPLPCDEVWVVGQPAPPLPLKKLEVAPGTYEWLCANFRYGINVFDFVKVEAGKHAELTFHWAIVVNDLQSPRGRIRVEDAFQEGKMVDLGIHQKELGMVIPADGRALKIEVRSLDGSRVEERYVRFRPGQKEVVKWSN